ncbi:MAG: hypothetical protein Q8L14_38415 [Myxococcales bacterium]|nr:hypothetical protein [Myxococcales bacterium]
MKRLALLLVVVAAPVFAASPANCEKFIKSVEKAGKASGKAPEAEGLAFFKGACLKDKEADATIVKQTKCLDGAKTEAAFNACFK